MKKIIIAIILIVIAGVGIYFYMEKENDRYEKALNEYISKIIDRVFWKLIKNCV